MLAFRTSALNFREPRTQASPRYRRLGFLACPYGVQKQSCWLSACERSASVPESAVCNNAARGELVGDTHYHCRQPAQCAREDAAAARKSTRVIISSSAGQDYTTTWVDPLEKAEGRAAAAAAETAAGAAGAAGAAADAVATRSHPCRNIRIDRHAIDATLIDATLTG